MTPAESGMSWHDANQRYLSLALDRLGAGLAGEPFDSEALERAAEGMEPPPALVTVAEVFGLSSFERDLLLLAAGLELDSAWARRLAELEPARGSRLTFGLALAMLPGAHWNALTPSAPLRYWQLLELGGGDGLTSRELRICERILHFLTGVHQLDERLQGFTEYVIETRPVGDTHRRLAEEIVASWRHCDPEERPVVELLGTDGAGKAAVAALVCSALEVPLLRMQGGELPVAADERERLALLWEREAVLTGSVLLLECERLEAPELRNALAFLRRLRAPVFACARDPLGARDFTTLGVDVGKPGLAEARALWHAELEPLGASLNGDVDVVLGQFNLGLQGIRAASARVRQLTSGDGAEAGRALWQACRGEARPQLEGLAERVEVRACWDDLVLPRNQKEMLAEIAVHLRQRATVYETWGFERKCARGLGFSAVFSGASGTGKTMAAEVIARALDLDLYRIDLSQVVSKYIGETEKNLGKIFDAAEGGGAILLFDEADALFGKRSEVRDSHDRYANVEVSYLLQRMESYRGLAVLTTNQKSALDPAFLRRLRFIVHFPFPDQRNRERIWRGIFPPEAPVEELDFARLARFDLTGGSIRNIALNAAFLAAEDEAPIGPVHLVRAARNEYSKLEKPQPENELRQLLEGRSAA